MSPPSLEAQRSDLGAYGQHAPPQPHVNEEQSRTGGSASRSLMYSRPRSIAPYLLEQKDRIAR